MGLSFCCIFVSVEDDISPLEVGQRLGVLSSSAKMTGKVAGVMAIPSGGVALGRFGEWSVVCGNSGLFIRQDHAMALDEISRSGRVFMWLTQSVTGGMWFEFHQGGLTRRRWVQIEGEVMECVGEPLPEEPVGMFTEGVSEDWDESQVIELGEKVTGIAWEALCGMEFEVYGEESGGILSMIKGFFGIK